MQGICSNKLTSVISLCCLPPFVSCSGEKVKDQNVDEANGKNEGVYSKGGVLHVEENGL